MTPTRFAETLERQLESVFFGPDAQAWLNGDLAAFDAWCAEAATLPARLCAGLARGAASGGIALLPPLALLPLADRIDLAQRALADEAFCGQPLWQGKPAETGAIARMQSHPLLTAWVGTRGRDAGARLLARLLELSVLPSGLREGAALVRAHRLAEGVGMALVETSRGLLLHVVRLAGGTVADYRIVAPTEWNFHPSGVLAELLAPLLGVTVCDSLVRRVEQDVRALDPCVAFAVELSHA